MIQTAISEQEAEFLRMTAEACAPSTFLEIGAQYGFSTCLLAEVASRNDGLVVSIDHHRGDENAGYGLTCNDFLLNTAGYMHVIVPIVAPTIVAGSILSRDMDFSLAFIDGGHDEESVRIDVRLVCNKLRIPKVVFHDYGRHVAVTEAVDNLNGYCMKDVVGTMAYVEVV